VNPQWASHVTRQRAAFIRKTAMNLNPDLSTKSLKMLTDPDIDGFCQMMSDSMKS
jgi:hypothetical protein